jgi:hypothetical protein
MYNLAANSPVFDESESDRIPDPQSTAAQAAKPPTSQGKA